jgi:hypothetical protein
MLMMTSVPMRRMTDDVNVVNAPDSYSIFLVLTFQGCADKTAKQVMRLHCIIYGFHFEKFELNI